LPSLERVRTLRLDWLGWIPLNLDGTDAATLIGLANLAAGHRSSQGRSKQLVSPIHEPTPL